MRSSLSFSSRRVPSSLTLLIAVISNSSGPKRLAKAICWLARQVLAGKDQQRVFEPGGVERLESLVVELGDAKAGHHGAERGVDRFDR